MTCLTLLMLTCLILWNDNNLSSVGHTMDEAKASLINETDTALNWIEANEMIANPERFHLMFLSSNKQDLINQQSIDIRGISLKNDTKFTLPGDEIDNRLTFHSHITYTEKLQIE